MSDIDWSTAPEGSKSHALIGSMDLEVWVGDKWYEYCYRGTRHYFGDQVTYSRSDLKNIIDRPAEVPLWTGEGLPPVGTVCEFDGEPVTIITHVHQPDADDDEYRVLAVGQKPNHGQIVIGAAKYFRPLRTPEQIAEESREAKAKELFQFINPESKWHKCDHEVWLAAIDAGWQKVAK